MEELIIKGEKLILGEEEIKDLRVMAVASNPFYKWYLNIFWESNYILFIWWCYF